MATSIYSSKHTHTLTDSSAVNDSRSYEDICAHVPSGPKHSDVLYQHYLYTCLIVKPPDSTYSFEPFVPENKELLLLITKRKTVICLLYSAKKTKRRQVREDGEIWRKSFQSSIWLVLHQLFHLL